MWTENRKVWLSERFVSFYTHPLIYLLYPLFPAWLLGTRAFSFNKRIHHLKTKSWILYPFRLSLVHIKIFLVIFKKCVKKNHKMEMYVRVLLLPNYFSDTNVTYFCSWGNSQAIGTVPSETFTLQFRSTTFASSQKWKQRVNRVKKKIQLNPVCRTEAQTPFSGQSCNVNKCCFRLQLNISSVFLQTTIAALFH